MSYDRGLCLLAIGCCFRDGGGYGGDFGAGPFGGGGGQWGGPEMGMVPDRRP